MFKKCLLFVCMCTLTFSVVYGGNQLPAGWSWNNISEAQLKNIQSKLTDENPKWVKDAIVIQLALFGKNSENMSYDQFKEVIKSLKTDIPASRIARALVGFYNFCPMILNDPEFKDDTYARGNVAMFVYRKDPTKFRDHFFVKKNIMVYANNHNSLAQCLKIYESNLIHYSNEVITSDLQLFKKVVYPKIDLNDSWKKIAVKIELMLKSAQ